jgi:ankyrin repeat protein
MLQKIISSKSGYLKVFRVIMLCVLIGLCQSSKAFEAEKYQKASKIDPKTPENPETPITDEMIAAARAASGSMFSTLLADQLEKLKDGEQVDINAKGEFGNTALHEAVITGNKAAVEALLKMGADINAVDDTKNSPLHDAIEEGEKAIFKLLASSPGFDPNKKGYWEWSYLHLAAQRGNLDAVKWLLEQPGIEVNELDNSGNTPLTAAKNPVPGFSEKHKDEIIRLLQAKGAEDPQEVTYIWEQNCLHLAAQFGNLDAVKWFLEQPGIDVNELNKHGETPLSVAKKRGPYFSFQKEKDEIIRLLKAKGAKDPEEKTP